MTNDDRSYLDYKNLRAYLTQIAKYPILTQEEEKKLGKKIQKGDKEALVKLIMNKKQEYYKLAYVYMKNKDDSLDALEDMILILHENIYKLKSNDSFYSWSKTILVNRCKTLLKNMSKVVPIDHLKEEYYDGDINRKDEKIVLEKYLSKLNDKHQDVLRLRYFLDLDYQSISEILKIPVGTVKSRINTALKKLKKSFGGEIF